MSKNIPPSENALNTGGPAFHPALSYLGRISETDMTSSPKKNKNVVRRFDSFKSLAEILGAPNDEEIQ